MALYFTNAEIWSDPNDQTSQMATGLCPGNYSVTVTDANGCSTTSTDTVDVIPGVESFADQIDLSIYPNPARGQFTINIEQRGISDIEIEIEIEIYNILGKSITRLLFRDVRSAVKTIDASMWNPGIYLVRVRIGDSQKALRLIVE